MRWKGNGRRRESLVTDQDPASVRRMGGRVRTDSSLHMTGGVDTFAPTEVAFG